MLSRMSLTAALTASLTDRCELLRELGRGGMATVYLARDVRRARQVAIKVLHPELAAVLGAKPDNRFPSQWPKEDVVAVTNRLLPIQADIGWITPTVDAPFQPFMNAAANEAELWISPDGTLAAYTVGDETGVSLFIRELPKPTGLWRVSPPQSGGARWSATGDWLYFWRSASPKDSLFPSRVTRSARSVDIGAAEFVLALDMSTRNSWDIASDGERFVIAVPSGGPIDSPTTPSRHVIVTNWFSELKARFAPARN